jgi:hypothetical protein
VIFAGFLLVHEAVLGEGGLQPVTGALVLMKRALQLEVFDGHQIHPPHIIGCAKTKFVHWLYVTLKVVFEQEPLDGSFGHRAGGQVYTLSFIYHVSQTHTIMFIK